MKLHMDHQSADCESANHWSDDQLLAKLYAVEPRGADEAHLDNCRECSDRWEAVQSQRNRHRVEAAAEIDDARLAEQRRAVYARIEDKPRWFSFVPVRHWASAAALVAVLGTGAALWERHSAVSVENRPAAVESRISDADLASQVSEIADDSEPMPAAPLRALFED